MANVPRFKNWGPCSRSHSFLFNINTSDSYENIGTY